MTTRTDGSVIIDARLNINGFNNSVSSISGSLENLGSRSGKIFSNIAKAAAAAFSIRAVVDFSKAAINSANEASNAQIGLQSILEGQGRSYENATTWINDYISDGLVPLQNAVTAYKNLAARGYDDTQIQGVLTALKDSASFGRQASYSLGEAVETASEGLKNENSILVDNAGVTKNVAKMWDDYAKLIGTTSNRLTQEQKIAAEVNGILEETKFQQGDAAKVAQSFSGELSRLLFVINDLKVTIGNILSQAISPFISILSDGISKLTLFIKELIKLSGMSVGNADIGASGAADSADDLASSAGAAAESYSDMASSAEAAAKANETTLAGFDKVNKLSEDKAGGTAAGNGAGGGNAAGNITVAPALDSSEVDSKLVKFFENITKKLQSEFESFAKFFDDNFGDIFREIFAGLRGEFSEFGKNLSGILSDIKTLAEPLAEYFENDFTPYMGQIFQTLGDIAVGLLDTFNMVFSDLWDAAVFPMLKTFVTDGLPLLTQFATEWWKTMDLLFKNIKKLFDTFWQTAAVPLLTLFAKVWTDTVSLLKQKWDEYGKPIFEGIRTALDSTTAIISDIWLKWIKPIFDEIIKAATNLWNAHLKPLLDNIISFFGTVALFALDLYNNTLAPIVQWVVDKLAPIVTWIGQTIVDTVGWAIGFVTDVFNGLVVFLTGVFSGDLSQAWEEIKRIFSVYLDGIKRVFADVPSWFKTQFQKAYTNIKTAFSGIKSWFSERWSDVKSVFSSVGTWFGERFTSAWGSIKSAFATVGTFFQGLWTSIKKPFATVATWFHDTFSKAWQKVKDVFSTGGEIFDGITAGISSVFTDTVNAIIDGINVVIATPFNEINSILQTLRDTEIAGWNPFENLPSLEVPSIPRLATGTVVPANYGEFLAVLGDNKREPEIVSPESAIISAVQKALGGGVGGDIYIELPILIDGHKMHKQIVKINKEEIRKTGKNPLAAN